ncbi:MAG: glycosyltransferase family 4 protein [Ruminococcaceae bacterium]|nr:glycosyltransferase family 4 protein [Oscillospiraceae bacterium]
MPKKKNKLLRVAMLGHKRIPSREGGVEIVVCELSQRMAEKGIDVTCFNRKGHHVGGSSFDTASLKEYKGVKLKNVFTIDKKGLAAMTSSFFATFKAAFGRYDVVHFHAEGPCAMLWLPRLFGKRCIATIHGLDHQRAKWGGFASRYIKAGEKCAVKRAHEIIVLSENVKNYFADVYKRNTVFIPNGVNRPEPLEAREITEKYGLKKDDYILFLGRLVPEKGITYLIDAFKNVDTDKKLLIAGGSSDTSEFEKELRKLANDDPRIIFTGFVQGRILEELYSNAYIYVLPSDLEGMPLSLLEAMSYSNCCLTSDIPECAEVIGENGVTFKKSDVFDLTEKLQMLCHNSDKVIELKSTACDYICSRYNWDDVTEKTLKLYEK